jgi:hypothetical protein
MPQCAADCVTQKVVAGMPLGYSSAALDVGRGEGRVGAGRCSSSSCRRRRRAARCRPGGPPSLGRAGGVHLWAAAAAALHCTWGVLQPFQVGAGAGAGAFQARAPWPSGSCYRFSLCLGPYSTLACSLCSPVPGRPGNEIPGLVTRWRRMNVLLKLAGLRGAAWAACAAAACCWQGRAGPAAGAAGEPSQADWPSRRAL